MKLGINIRNWGPTATPECIAACARYADQSSLDSIWVNDHIGLPPEFDRNPYGISPDMAHILDPLGIACFLAAITTRIRFGTGVLILPYRPALLTAKWLATIQTLSHGRFLLGTGVGYLDEEFSALGVSKRDRGRINDETLEFLATATETDVLTSNGTPLVIKPRLQRPPIYIGGAPATAIPRAIRYGDGWMPVGLSPDELQSHVAELQRLGADAGRAPLEVVHMKTLPLSDLMAAQDLARAYANVGVTHLVHTQGVQDEKEFAVVVDSLCRAIQFDPR
ncbi:MAG: TIGR03619 family F420-dependent LLM class oxidoreductase [Dehalococcoidia bacterium]